MERKHLYLLICDFIFQIHPPKYSHIYGCRWTAHWNTSSGLTDHQHHFLSPPDNMQNIFLNEERGVPEKEPLWEVKQ